MFISRYLHRRLGPHHKDRINHPWNVLSCAMCFVVRFVCQTIIKYQVRSQTNPGGFRCLQLLGTTDQVV